MLPPSLRHRSVENHSGRGWSHSLVPRAGDAPVRVGEHVVGAGGRHAGGDAPVRAVVTGLVVAHVELLVLGVDLRADRVAVLKARHPAEAPALHAAVTVEVDGGDDGVALAHVLLHLEVHLAGVHVDGGRHGEALAELTREGKVGERLGQLDAAELQVAVDVARDASAILGEHGREDLGALVSKVVEDLGVDLGVRVEHALGDRGRVEEVRVLAPVEGHTRLHVADVLAPAAAKRVP
mmetsp:Transcript_5219/g.17547  ORF Transcript_5219/g.17547 Transcript_5219/m.17547 type:complete len:237 (+) Transcript_5219:3659-4369(+)